MANFRKFSELWRCRARVHETRASSQCQQVVKPRHSISIIGEKVIARSFFVPLESKQADNMRIRLSIMRSAKITRALGCTLLSVMALASLASGQAGDGLGDLGLGNLGLGSDLGNLGGSGGGGGAGELRRQQQQRALCVRTNIKR